jgi:hypothetical protein
MVPYLPLSSRFALAATSKPFHAIIFNDSSTFRHLNLATIKGTDFDSSPIDPGGINWRTERMDEALTEDEFYSGPIYGIFAKLEKQQWLRFVSTLVLDGLAVPADLVREIISEDRFNVRILSIREAKHLNVRKLCQVLNYAVRPTRAVGMPKLRGLYVFGPMEPAAIKEELAIEGPVSPTRYSDSQSQDTVRAVGAKLGAEWNQKSQDTLGTELIGARDKWYQSTGAILPRKQLPEWADTLRACEGIIYFDAVLCRGPRHEPPTTPRQIRAYLPPAVGTAPKDSPPLDSHRPTNFLCCLRHHATALLFGERKHRLLGATFQLQGCLCDALTVLKDAGASDVANGGANPAIIPEI